MANPNVELSKGKGHPDILFGYDENGRRIVPRTILVDLERSVVDEISTQYPAFEKTCISPREGGAAKNYGKGRTLYTKGAQSEIFDVITAVIGDLSYCRGILMIHAVGGGTGSGFAARLLQSIREMNKDTPIISAAILPDPKREQKHPRHCSFRLSKETRLSR